MSNAIRDVSETLLQLLQTQLSAVTPVNSIGLLSPADVKKVSNGDIRLGLSLYSIVPTADYRNESEILGDSDRKEPPSVMLDLYYLLTAYPSKATSDGNYDAQIALGTAMRVFFENGTISGSLLRGDLPRDWELRLTLQPMTVEDLTRIFGVFPENALETSVSYVVSPVKLLSKLIPEQSPRVASREAQSDAIIPAAREN